MGTITAAYLGTVPKYFGSGASVNVSGAFSGTPAGFGAAGQAGGIGDPIWSDEFGGTNKIDANDNLVDGYFLQTSAGSNESFTYTTDIIASAVPPAISTGIIQFYGSLCAGFAYPVGGNQNYYIFDYTVGESNAAISAISIADPAWIGSELGLTGPFTWHGQKYFTSLMDGLTLTGEVILYNKSGAILATVWNGPSTVNDSGHTWTDGTLNYILISGVGVPNIPYVAICDDIGNELSRNDITIADPYYNQFLTGTTFHTVQFVACTKGFYAPIFPLPPQNTQREIMLLQPDGSGYTVYNCLATDAETAQVLTQYEPATNSLVWGFLNTESVYIDGSDHVWIASYATNGNGPVYIFMSLDFPSSSSPMLAQPLGACWPCGVTSRGIH